MERTQVAIIGAGIAGVSAAAKLSARGISVCVLEQYNEYPYGATGRSAALFAKSYFSSPQFAMLTRATQSFLERPTADFTDTPLVFDRGAVYFAGAEDAVKLANFCMQLGEAGVHLPILYRNDVADLVPIVRKEKVIFGVFEKDAKDMDVNAIFKGYERQATRNGTRIVSNAEVINATWSGKYWSIHTRAGSFEADVLLNAAGAWGDVVASRCGILQKGLQPLRRTALIAKVQDEGARCAERMPFVFRASDDLYWCDRPEGFLISPSDATLSEACDAQPEIEDVARAIEAFEEITTLRLASSRPHAWAGLRTFAPDKKPVVGYEPGDTRFFWLCGQGGYGIQTSDAMARLATSLLLDGVVPMDLQTLGLREDDISPARFRIYA